MQSLIDRFEELASAGTEPAAAEQAGDAPNGEQEPAAAATAAHNQALEAASRSLTGQDAALAKLRTHFHKVGLLPNASISQSGFNASWYLPPWPSCEPLQSH